MRPKDRFTKGSEKRYKALRKITRTLVAPGDLSYIPGRTAGFKYPYVEVIKMTVELPSNRQVITRYGKVYFDGKLTKKFVKRELNSFMEEQWLK